MTSIVESVDVQVPVRTAYNQWTRFEEFPRFMDGVQSVDQIDERHLHWVAESGGNQQAWTAEIVEQRPDERLAWKSIEGQSGSSVILFHSLGEHETRVTVQMEQEAEGLREQLGSALGRDNRRVQGDLERFKELVEARGDTG
jgi:uncharacterized membrane protein